jgi:hypothetical protein
MRRCLWSCLIPLLVIAITTCTPLIRREWQVAVEANSVEAYETFLRQHPNGLLAEDVASRLEAFLTIARSIRSVRVSVDEFYSADRTQDAIKDVQLPFAVLTRDLLKFAAIDVSASGEEADAVILVDVEGSALAQSYAAPDERHSVGDSTPRIRQFAGARLWGTLSLQTPNVTIHTRAFQGTIAPPARIVRAVYMSPGAAPFADLLRTCFGPELAGMILTLYGIEPVVAALTSDSPVVRNSAAVALGRQPEKAATAVEPLIAALETDGDILVRESAAWSLGRIGDARAVEPLINCVQREFDRDVRERAVTALGEIGDFRAVETLINVAGRDAQEVRSKAMKALRSITGQQFGANPNRWGAWWSEGATADSGNVPGGRH